MSTRDSLVVGLLVTALSPFAAAEEWDRFRGENGTGVSPLKGVPSSWTADDYEWNVELPGIGHAAPIVSAGRIFVTSAIDEGAVRYLHCLDLKSGKAVWSRSIELDPSHKHAKNSWASSTPCADGERVYFAFADGDDYALVAYDFDGKLAWRQPLGKFDSQHGHGVSPIVYDDLVILTNDQKGPSSIFAFDRKTGKKRWTAQREFRRTSYATPIVLERAGDVPRLICVSGATGITSFDPRTGREHWSTESYPLRTVASPVYGDGIVVASCGQGGKGGVLQRGVNVETGDVVWERTRELPYVPTPIVRGKYLFNWGDAGVVACVELKTGKTIWRQRVGSDISGSPVCIDGKLFAITEKGDVHIIRASPKFERLGTVSLGEPSHSTPAVAEGRLLLRTYHRLASLSTRN